MKYQELINALSALCVEDREPTVLIDELAVGEIVFEPSTNTVTIFSLVEEDYVEEESEDEELELEEVKLFEDEDESQV